MRLVLLDLHRRPVVPPEAAASAPQEPVPHPRLRAARAQREEPRVLRMQQGVSHCARAFACSLKIGF